VELIAKFHAHIQTFKPSSGVLIMRALLLALLVTLSGTAAAETNEPPAQDQGTHATIPIAEKDFVSNINKFEKNAIIKQFGEPSGRTDIKSGKTGEVIASIWHYHFLNTSDADGAYYPTTELDFIGEKVVLVVFMNNNGEKLNSEPTEPSQQAPEEQEEPLPEFSPEMSI